MRGLAAAVLAAAALAACGASTPDTELPDLSGLGLASTPCEDTEQMAGIVADQPDAVLACWTGAPEDGFVDAADAVLDLVLAANPDAEDVTGALCWDDTVTDAEASACRAVLVGDLEDGSIVSAVVALADPAGVVGGISDEPTEDEVAEALAGADVEVLVFSEPAAAETGDL
ncbi:hypothetical protein [Demequina iriomotensis]|uniref:hypothetical protein n=1 Tax=Demequina iriomotensis TaxID=1536641 RepID=UPI0012E09B9F|nr:hypothetical protein [Demequina iriomotensis]